MTLKEYEVKDPNFGTTRFQWDVDRDGKDGMPKGAKAVGSIEPAVAPESEANPAPVEESQEPAEKADQAPANKAEPAPDNK